MWYVCPRTGLLRRVEDGATRRPPKPRREETPPFIKVSESMQCHLIAGAWHLVEVKPLPLDLPRCQEHDVVLDRPVSAMAPLLGRKHYGAAVYAASKRRLAFKELRQLPIPMHLWR